MAPTLKVNFAGVSMPNPFMLSSAPPTTNVEMVARCFEAGWGGAVLKTLAYTLSQAQNVNPRITAVKSADGDIVGFTNFELGSPKPIEKWAEDTRWLKERFPEHGVWVSLLHTEGLVEEQWREVTRMFDQAGADGFELNFSCSHGMAESGGGATVGCNEEAIKMVTTWVREETKKPVMPKLPRIVQDIPGKARAAEAAGADAIASINTLNSLPGIDIHTFVPYPSVDGRSAFQGLSGAAVKPVALRTVAQIAKAVNIPVSGIGGIYNWRDAVEFILAGASSLQVCSAVMHHGYRIINDMTARPFELHGRDGLRNHQRFLRQSAAAHLPPQRPLARLQAVFAGRPRKVRGLRALRGRVRRQRVQRHPSGREPQGHRGQRQV